jgi:Mg2+-importing ATPase
VFITAVLSFIRECRATHAVEKSRRRVSIRSTVLHGSQSLLLPAEKVVPSDIVLLAAGRLIPGDGMLIEAVAVSEFTRRAFFRRFSKGTW